MECVGECTVCVCFHVHVCVWRQRRVNIDSSSSPVSQSVCEVHPHFFNLRIYECDLRAAVGGTLSIFVPQKWDVCQPRKALRSDANCFIHVLFSEGIIDFLLNVFPKGEPLVQTLHDNEQTDISVSSA